MLTTTLLRIIFIPLGCIYGVYTYRSYLLDARQMPMGLLMAIVIISGIWILITFKLINNAKKEEPTEFLKKNYHSKIILFLMTLFARALYMTAHFAMLLKKPFLFSWLGTIGALLFKGELVLPYIEKYIPYLFFFTVFSILSTFFLTAREETLISNTQVSLANIKEKTLAFKRWVYQIDDPSVNEVNESFIPKDKIPSIIYFATHFLKVLFKYILRALILFLTKYKMKKGLIVLLPLVAIGEFLIFVFNLLVLGFYGAVSFTLRIIFYSAYFAGFLAALYYNVHNLVVTFETKSAHQFANGLLITFAVFFALECIRHLNLELPIFTKSQP